MELDTVYQHRTLYALQDLTDCTTIPLGTNLTRTSSIKIDGATKRHKVRRVKGRTPLLGRTVIRLQTCLESAWDHIPFRPRHSLLDKTVNKQKGVGERTGTKTKERGQKKKKRGHVIVIPLLYYLVCPSENGVDKSPSREGGKEDGGRLKMMAISSRLLAPPQNRRFPANGVRGWPMLAEGTKKIPGLEIYGIRGRSQQDHFLVSWRNGSKAITTDATK